MNRGWLVGGNIGLGDALWLIKEAKPDCHNTFIGTPRTAEIVRVASVLTTVKIDNVVELATPEEDSPGIPEYREWVKKYYTPHPDDDETFFDYPLHGNFGSFPLRCQYQPKDYTGTQLFSHRSKHHWPALDEFMVIHSDAHRVVTFGTTRDEPWVGHQYQGTLMEVAQAILKCNIFIGLASGITGLAVFLGVPTVVVSAIGEEFKVPPHMRHLVQPTVEQIRGAYTDLKIRSDCGDLGERI